MKVEVPMSGGILIFTSFLELHCSLSICPRMHLASLLELVPPNVVIEFEEWISLLVLDPLINGRESNSFSLIEQRSDVANRFLHGSHTSWKS